MTTKTLLRSAFAVQVKISGNFLTQKMELKKRLNWVKKVCLFVFFSSFVHKAKITFSKIYCLGLLLLQHESNMAWFLSFSSFHQADKWQASKSDKYLNFLVGESYKLSHKATEMHSARLKKFVLHFGE